MNSTVELRARIAAKIPVGEAFAKITRDPSEVGYDKLVDMAWHEALA